MKLRGKDKVKSVATKGKKKNHDAALLLLPTKENKKLKFIFHLKW
jgi:hypothetical protein